MARINGDVSAALRVEVQNLSEDVHGFRTELRDVRAVMSTRSDLEAVSAQIASVAANLNIATRPQYGLIISLGGLSLAILSAIGAMAYWPVTRAVDRNEVAIDQLQRASVGRNSFNDYQNAIKQIFVERQKQIEQNSTRLLALEQHDREKIQNIAKNTARIEEQSARYDAISRRLAEHIRDYSAQMLRQQGRGP